MALGILAAARRDSWLDHGLSVGALAVTALPEFVVAMVLVVFFAALVWHLFPAVSVFPPGVAPWSTPSLLVLPVATLVIVIVPYIFRMMRATMIEALESDYVEMARLKGCRGCGSSLVHALPNAIAPTIQVIGLNFLYLAGGVVVVEYVFNYPGLGQGLVAPCPPGHPDDPVHRAAAGRLLRVREHRYRLGVPRRLAAAPAAAVT